MTLEQATPAARRHYAAACLILFAVRERTGMLDRQFLLRDPIAVRQEGPATIFHYPDALYAYDPERETLDELRDLDGVDFVIRWGKSGEVEHSLPVDGMRALVAARRRGSAGRPEQN